jgi:asparagine synthase (glutamine-hydrolysing)
VAATAAVKAFYAPEVVAELATEDPLDRRRASLPETFYSWKPLERAAYLELRTLLEPYLLAAQADRVAMAHGVEGRFPFLDHRVFEHASRLPTARKLDGLREKVALRDLAARVLPPGVPVRRKQPYRAPEVAPFFVDGPPEWVEDRLSPSALRAAGIFDDRRVAGLLRRCRAGLANGPREGMALVGILSTQVWWEQFFTSVMICSKVEDRRPEIRIDMRREVVT